MKSILKFAFICILGFAFVLNSFQSFSQTKVTSPEEYFGFQMGADYKLARWDKIVEYFYQLEKQSDKIKVMDLGPSSEGHPFLLTIISSPKNLANLDRLQFINKKITDPRGVTKDSLEVYIEEGKAIVFESMSLHASEVGGTQMSPELAYDLLTRDDSEAQRILDNVLFFMVPCFNPDGEVMITDWYNETVGTEYEGLSMPYLYHKYCGHDNNRDGDYFNLQESRYMAKAMYVDWQPQAYVDHHHMGPYGARFYVPPYCDPIRPYADPLVWRELSWYGAHIAYKLEEGGFQGVLNAAQYAGWGHFGWHWITPFHNIAGMLTESAGVNLATPVYVHPDQLKGNVRMFQDYEAQSTFPDPWPGGWWHLRDIVAQQKSAAWSALDLAARNKETVLETAVLKAERQTNRGAEANIKTLIIPMEQHDHSSAIKMINKLLQSGIEIRKADEEFVAESKIYGEGSYIITLAQPRMGLIMNLLTETHYADNSWTRSENGVPYQPYDMATHTMNEFMGVDVDPLSSDIKTAFPIIKTLENIPGTVEKGTAGYWIDGRENAAFAAVNLLLDENIKIKRTDAAIEDLRPGDFIIEKAAEDKLTEIAAKTGVCFLPLESIPGVDLHDVVRGRTALFQRYFGGNSDEGWTRLCFEDFGFDYTTLMSEEINVGSLGKKYDVIVLPSDSKAMITGDFKGNSWMSPAADYPEKYRGSLGKEGTEALKTFVSEGGTLVVFGNSYDFATDVFDLKIKNVTQGLESTQWFCPGSTLKVDFDNTQPLAYGMPDEGLVVNYSSPAFEVLPGRHNDDYTTIARYKDKNLLKSGWLIGEKTVAKKQAMLTVKYGEGEVVLIGFRTQHRDQTDGTFKLLFNSIIR